VIAAAVWNEVNTGATHNVANSTGKQLRSIAVGASDVIYTATAPAQAGMTSTQITLDAGASAANNAYQFDVLSITSGTDAGDSRIITGYVGATKVATVSRAWTVQPDATSVFEITPTASTQVVSYLAGQAPLQPTVAGRTLDVSSTGGAGIDWANIKSPTTTVGLTGTTISTSQVVASVTGAVGSVTANVGGDVTGKVLGGGASSFTSYGVKAAIAGMGF